MEFDVMPDGKSFVVMYTQPQDGDKPAPPQINVVLNWYAELKQRLAGPQ